MRLIGKMVSFILICTLFLSSFQTLPSQAKEKSNKFVEKTVSIQAHDHNVPGILSIPKYHFHKKVPVVLLLHGLGGDKNEVGNLFQRTAQILAKQGYASLRIDFAGSGDSQQPFVLHNLEDAIRDSQVALNFLRKHPQIDSNRIGILGFSQGGRISQIVAARDPQIKALATWASAAGNGIQDFESLFQYAEEAKKNGSVKVPMFGGKTLEFGTKWFESIEQSRAMEEMIHFKGNLLAIHGDRDPVVLPIRARELLRYAGSYHATLHIIRGAGHSFNVLGPDGQYNVDQSTAQKVITTTSNWFLRHL
ncbi:hypothetical protein ABE42_17320 [Bacillus thuringiensis]|nr:alpha/beta fold hydrolase [Bacillus thuringiensis]MBG9536359.1 hypothetical protein [Bacillus thuringiensis]MBG9580910.1 hypothetical protein [Bacillus thuringiensis]